MQLWDIDTSELTNVRGKFQKDIKGKDVWTMVFKRAWVLSGDEWLEQEEVIFHEEPLYLGEPGLSAIQAESDFAFSKTNTDLVVTGKVRSYAKKPVTHMQCRVLIDEHVDKTLYVYGDREWIQHGGAVTCSQPKPFIEKAVDYSNAMGGDARNRIGCGALPDNRQLQERGVPSVFYPNQNWQANAMQVAVAGFGPVAAFSEPRSRYAGTYDEEWYENQRPFYPQDCDERFFQVVPEDQQCNGFLVGGERLLLSGFCHNGPLSFRVPSDKYLASAEFMSNRQKEMSLYTLSVDTDSRRIEATYSASFPCEGEGHQLAKSQVVKLKEC